MKIAVIAAVLALASPLAAFAQAPGEHVTRTIVTHQETHVGPVTTTRTIAFRPIVHHRRFVRHHHVAVHKTVVRGLGHDKIVTTTTVTRR